MVVSKWKTYDNETMTYCGRNILRPLMGNSATRVGLNEPARRSANGAAHVGDKKTALRLGADLIGDRAEEGPVAVGELGRIRVGYIPVEGCVLGLEQRQESSTDESLAVG